jgi:hypothetical protein
MPEVMSIDVSDEDQWLVVNGRPVEYYASDTAFLDGRKVWASQRAAVRLAEALTALPDVVDFVSAGFPDAIVTLPTGDRMLVHGAISLAQLGLEASDAHEVQEEDLVILARELISRARAKGAGVESAPEPVIA